MLCAARTVWGRSVTTAFLAFFWFILSSGSALTEPVPAPPLALGPEAQAAVQAIHRLHRPRPVSTLTGEERTLRELERATTRVKQALIYTATRTNLAEAEESLELAEAEFARWESIRGRVGAGATSSGRGRRVSGPELDAQLRELHGTIEVSGTEARALVGMLKAEASEGVSRSPDQVKTSSQHQRAVSAFLQRHKRKPSLLPVPYRPALVTSSEAKPVRFDAENPRLAPRSVAGTRKPAPSHPLAGRQYEPLPSRNTRRPDTGGTGRPVNQGQAPSEEVLP